MERKTKSRLLIGGLVVFSALIAIYTYSVFLKSENQAQDWQAFLLNVSTELIGALIVFFFFNLFFFLDDWDLSERVQNLLNRLERERPKAEKFFHRMPDIDPMIREAQAIDLCGVSLTSTINKQITSLRAAVENGKKIRLLIIDPRSLATEMANARSETQDLSYYTKRLDASFSDINYLYEKWKEINSSKGSNNFQVRLMPYAPSFGIQIFHKSQASGTMNVDIYPHHVGYGSPPIFTLHENDDLSWFDYFRNQFNSMWNKSVEWRPELFEVDNHKAFPQLSTAKAQEFLFESNRDLAPYFQNAEDIRIFGIDLNSTILNYRDSFMKCLESENCSIQLIFTSEAHHQAKQKDSIEQLKWIISNPKSKGLIELREFNGNAFFSIFATNPLLPDGRIQIKIYNYSWRRFISPKFELFKNRDPKWMEYFLDQFDDVWIKSTPILSSMGNNDN